MSEPTNTEVQGDVQGSVQSGAFHGPVQTVNVHIPREPEQPRTPREYLDSMWKILLEDQRQRRSRQLSVDRWLLALTVVQLICLAGLWYVIWLLVLS